MFQVTVKVALAVVARWELGPAEVEMAVSDQHRTAVDRQMEADSEATGAVAAECKQWRSKKNVNKDDMQKKPPKTDNLRLDKQCTQVFSFIFKYVTPYGVKIVFLIVSCVLGCNFNKCPSEIFSLLSL